MWSKKREEKQALEHMDEKFCVKPFKIMMPFRHPNGDIRKTVEHICL